MKLKAILFPIAIGTLALLGACSDANDTPAGIDNQPGVVEQAPESMESPGAMPMEPDSPSSMESPAPTGTVPPAN